MRRNNLLTKMERRTPTKTPTCFEEIQYNFGGCTAFPPDDCPYSAVFHKGADRVHWIDNMFCTSCKRKKTCDPYKTHRKAVNQQMRELAEENKHKRGPLDE